MTHALKTISPYFEDVESGNKNFELRKYDRPYECGDTLILQHYSNGKYTGKEQYYTISYILKNVPTFGLKKGYCILGLKEKIT